MIDPSLIEHLRGLEPHLRAHIRGQNHVLPRLALGFIRAALRLPSPERPGYSCLLVGPTGTGKSESFRQAAEYVFGRNGLVIFDLSEYQDRSSIDKLLGEDRRDPGLLGRALGGFPRGAILFDEIEKAHPLIMDVFLQMLWRGCVTVATGETLRFGDHIIGFSSNIGAAESMRMRHLKFPSVEQATLRRLARTLRPELLGRIQDKLIFAGLDSSVQREICALEVDREIARLKREGFDVRLSREVAESILRNGFDREFGARPLHVAIGSELQSKIAQRLLGHQGSTQSAWLGRERN